jgi:hypothetical protein
LVLAKGGAGVGGRQRPSQGSSSVCLQLFLQSKPYSDEESALTPSGLWAGATLPVPSQPLRHRASEFEGCKGREALDRLQPALLHLCRGRSSQRRVWAPRGQRGVLAEGPGSQKWASSGARALGYSPGDRRCRGAGARRQERAGPPLRWRGAGRSAARTPGVGTPPPPPPRRRRPRHRERCPLPLRARPRMAGPSAARRSGQWRSAELATPRLLFLSLEARSCSRWVGAKGRGRGPGEARGGRRGPEGASEEPGSGARAPTPPQ